MAMRLTNSIRRPGSELLGVVLLMASHCSRCGSGCRPSRYGRTRKCSSSPMFFRGEAVAARSGSGAGTVITDPVENAQLAPQRRAQAIPPVTDNQPISVMLDFVNPIRAGGRFRSFNRLSWDNEPARKRLEFHGAEKIGRRVAGNNELSVVSSLRLQLYRLHTRQLDSFRAVDGGVGSLGSKTAMASVRPARPVYPRLLTTCRDAQLVSLGPRGGMRRNL
jgi:hypothetical protein